MPELAKFTKSTSIQAHFSHRTLEYTVDVHIPDLSESPHRCWGDWGPMYLIELQAHQAIRIAYRSSKRGLLSEYTLRPKVVELNSPMFAQEREKHPFCLEFSDQPRGLRFSVYFDNEGKVGGTKVKVERRNHDIDEAIFPQAQFSQMDAADAQMSA